MKHLIANIKNIPGVVGVAIFKDSGNLAAFDFPGTYDRNLLELMGLKFQPIKEILPQDEGEIVYLCWEYEELLAFYYPVPGGWITIISSVQIPMPVFSLTMTAVANKLPAMLKETTAAAEEALEPAPAAVVENIVTPEAIDQLKKFFALYLGPAAPVIFKRVAQHLGIDGDHIPVQQWQQILDGMTAKVPDQKKDEVMEKIKSLTPVNQ